MAESKAWVMIPKHKGTEVVIDVLPLVLCKDCRFCEHCEVRDLMLNHENGFCADGEANVENDRL